jgi:RHS repeat-associated protein
MTDHVGWGMGTIVGNANPFRYRSYYWDSETGLYYLQSRYYNPQWGRFINADEPSMLSLTSRELVGANLFAYCLNNPVMHVDPDGYSSSWDRGLQAQAYQASYSTFRSKLQSRLRQGFTVNEANSVLSKVDAIFSINNPANPFYFGFGEDNGRFIGFDAAFDSIIAEIDSMGQSELVSIGLGDVIRFLDESAQALDWLLTLGFISASWQIGLVVTSISLFLSGVHFLWRFGV